MTDQFLPCGEYLPDQASYGGAGSALARNVVPRTKRSFSPMPAFSRIATTALGSAPLGAFSSVDTSGSPGMYVGTATKLYAATSGSKPNFSDASGTQTFTVPDGGFWSFCAFNGKVLATNGSDPIQTATAATAGPFAALNAVDAPTAKVIAAIQPGFVVAGNINDVTEGVQPQGIRWSVLGDATSWPAIGTTDAIAGQSDWQAVQGDHGVLQAIAPNLATCNAALFFERAIFRMVYTGDSTIFAILPAEKLRGTPAPRSVVQVGQVSYYLSHDGFYAFDGTVSVPIGAGKVNRTFLADCDPNFLSAVEGVADPLSGLCFWLYPGAGNNAGAPNRILCYHSVLGRWAFIDAFAGSSLFLALAFGTSIDGIDALGYNIDTVPYSLDSAFLAGGRLTLGAFDDSFYFGAFSGSNMAFAVETVEAQFNQGGRTRVSAVRPVTEGDTAKAAVAGRNLLSDPVPATTGVAPNVSGAVPVRNEARYHRAILSADADNSVSHILGAELSIAPGGKR